MRDASGEVTRDVGGPLDIDKTMETEDLPVSGRRRMMAEQSPVVGRSKRWLQVLENRIVTMQAISALDRVRPH